MRWFVTSIALMAYPIGELTRYIWVYYSTHPEFLSTAVIETSVMWVAWLLGVGLLAWRLQKAGVCFLSWRRHKE